MRTNDRRIIKHTVSVMTVFNCYADDVWVIPLQDKNEPTPEIYDNGVVDNHGEPYIIIFHADDDMPEKQGRKKNEWRVSIERMNADNEMEIFANGSFKTAREALNSSIVEDAIAGRMDFT